MKFDYSLIPDPMEKLWGMEITDDLRDRIIKSRNQIEADKKDFEESGDFNSIFMWLESHRCFAFVIDNYKPLQDMGVFEAALFASFTHTKSNNSNIQKGLISILLKMADREKLMSMGDPLPEDKDTYTRYRGIAGKGAARRKYGHSWTGPLDRLYGLQSGFLWKNPWFTRRLFQKAASVSIAMGGLKMNMSV